MGQEWPGGILGARSMTSGLLPFPWPPFFCALHLSLSSRLIDVQPKSFTDFNVGCVEVRLLRLLHGQVGTLPLVPPGKPLEAP